MISFDNFILLQSLLVELQHGWFLCFNHIFLSHSILIFELCIMIIWLLLQSKFLLDCIMVGSCVTTMIVFVSNYILIIFENTLYAHNNNVIFNIFWRYVAFLMWYECGKIWIWMYPPSTYGIGNFMKWGKEVFFPKIIILAFQGILW